MTDAIPLNVKWNKDSFKVSFVLAGGVKGLKNELEEKTGVPSDRMKLMAKSKGTFALDPRIENLAGICLPMYWYFVAFRVVEGGIEG